MKNLTRDGVALAYNEDGTGDPPMVLVHCWVCDHTFFAPQFDHFSGTQRVIAVDLRGHGESDKPQQAYTVAGFAEDLVWLCRQLAVEKPVVVGHSMGGKRGTLGGNPSGVVSGETFRWWKRMVEQKPSSIIISAHHYMLKNTTTASGEWEGMRRDEKGGWKDGYHGYYEGKGTPQGASYLYWVDSKQDSGALENFLGASPGRVALWLGAHTHTAPDDTYGGKSHIERRWGTTFINVAGLTKYMGAAENCVPRSSPGHDGMRCALFLFSNAVLEDSSCLQV